MNISINGEAFISTFFFRYNQIRFARIISQIFEHTCPKKHKTYVVLIELFYKNKKLKGKNLKTTNLVQVKQMTV